MSVIKDELLGNYLIECDGTSYILKYNTGNVTKKDNKEIVKTEGYYTNLSSALNKVVKLQCQSEDVTRTLKEHFEVESKLMKELIDKLGE